MTVDNWDQWMSDHHIKLKGSVKQNDHRTDAGANCKGVFGTNLATSLPRNEQSTGCRHLQKYGAGRSID